MIKNTPFRVVLLFWNALHYFFPYFFFLLFLPHLFPAFSRSRSFFPTLPWLIKLVSDDNKHCDVALLRVHVVTLFIAKIGRGWVTVDNDNVARDCGN